MASFAARLVLPAGMALVAFAAPAVVVEVDEGSIGMGSVTWAQGAVSGEMVSLTLKAFPVQGCAFSGWRVDGSVPEWASDARNPSLSGVRVATNASVMASFTDCSADPLQFDVADALSWFECGERVEVQLDVDSVSFPSLSFQGLPSGLSYDPKTLTVSGVPNTPCWNKVVVTGVNGSGCRFTQTFRSSVGDMSTARLSGDTREIVLGEYFHAEFSEMFTVNGERMSATVSGVPTGMTWNPEWDLLYGTPTKAGVYIIKGTVRFLDGKSDTATFRLTVAAPDPREYDVETDSLADLVVGDILESGDVELGTYKDRAGIVSVSGLPDGLSVETRVENDVKHYGVVGTVRAAGLFTVNIGVVDSSGSVPTNVTTSFDIIVTDTPYRYFKVRVSDLSPVGSGTVSGGGAISVVSGARVVARPAKGYVFAGWRDAAGEVVDVGAGVDYRSPSIVYGADTDFEFMELFALFAPAEQDSELSLSELDGSSFEFDADGAMDEEFYIESVSLPTLTVKGLPSGVSIVPGLGSLHRIVYDPETATTRPSPGRYAVVLTAKNASGASDSASFLLTVGNISDERISVEDDYGEYAPDEEIEPIDLSDAVDYANGETLTVSGLPRGLVYNKAANDKKGIEAHTITGAPTAPGFYTLTFTAKVIASESTNASGRVTYSYETAKATAFLTVLPYPLLSVVVDEDSSAAGNSVTGGGNYKSGTKVTLKAKAADGWVFSGWDGLWNVDGLALLNPSLSVTTGSDDLEVDASFVPVSEDSLSLAQPPLTEWGFAAELELGVDVASGVYEAVVLDMIETVSYPVVKVSGLPSGVKFSSSTFLLSGKPTKSGVYYVTVEAKNAGGYSFTRILRIAVLDSEGNPPDEPDAGNAAQIDFSPLEGLVTGTYYAKGDVTLEIGSSPSSGAKPVKATISGVPAGLAASVEAAGDELAVFFVGTPTKVARYAVTVKVTYEDKKILASKAYLITEDGGSAYLFVSSLDESFGTVAGEGVYSAGATVKLSAKPKAKYVFSGWLADIGEESAEPFAPLMDVEDVDFRTASVSFPFRPNDIVGYYGLLASFSSAADDAEVAVSLSDSTWEIDPKVISEFAFTVDSLSLPKVSTKNLPKGVAVDLARGKLVYTPTDSVKSGVYLATITVQNQSKAFDSAGLEVFVANRECEAIGGLDSSKDAYHMSVGVSLDPLLLVPEVNIEDGWKLFASGLPAGFKFVQDKATGEYSITGVPTAKSGYYTVTFTASKKGEKSQVATVTIRVDALPEWAIGNFDGTVEGGGLSSFSVSASGKISGKLLEGGRTWTLSSASFAAVETPASGDSPSFFANVIGKCGKIVETNFVTLALKNGRGVVSGLMTSEPPIEWTAWQNLWKTEQWKVAAKLFSKANTLMLYISGDESAGRNVLVEPPDDGSPYDTIALRFASSGVVSATGKFVVGYNEKSRKNIVHLSTCSSYLIPFDAESETGNYNVYLYFPPKSGVFGGFCAAVPLEWDGVNFSLSE